MDLCDGKLAHGGGLYVMRDLGKMVLIAGQFSFNSIHRLLGMQ